MEGKPDVKINHCNATLVGTKLLLPTDPSAFSRGFPWVGCNHIVCDDCDAAVAHVDDASPSSGSLSRSHNAASFLWRGPAYKGNRAYFCSCAWMGVSAYSHDHAGDCERTSTIRWSCAGHPDDAAGTRGAAIARRHDLFKQAMGVAFEGGTAEFALAAWEPLCAVAGTDQADRANTFRQLMNLTHNTTIRGRAAIALGKLIGNFEDAISVLSATIRNSDDLPAKQEAAALLAQHGLTAS